MSDARYGESHCPICRAPFNGPGRGMYAARHNPGCSSLVAEQQRFMDARADLGRALLDSPSGLALGRFASWLARRLPGRSS